MDPAQLAFQEYMLGGKKKSEAAAVSTPSPAGSKKQSQESASWKKRKKQASPVFKAIQGKLEEWNDVDGQLGAVLESVGNLRFRIWCASRKIRERKRPGGDGRERGGGGGGGGGENEWESCGPRGGDAHDVLELEDIDLAMNHDLLQHERMIGAARALISSLAQVLDALGRRMNEWMMLDYPADGADSEGLLEKTEQLFVLLSEQLYRKQLLVKQVLDSCHDGLIEEGATFSGDQGGNPRTLARRACSEWNAGDNKGSLAIKDLLRIGSLQL
eukprot:CAMPEP_0117081356 /NCGR_PEP_ID=MMETSP0472-20121206/57345_1 /TAXON_ID=693140 ORGANISM="Tiarina fusus, Strain LIS" /NCGR_SAMPLE_ID=MMETSP0472 /ASSEMBLY_ACC=CAM_ASM_000603 /LENGTH=271 /DNA_ID=CAMNT_0004809261 /DNA_START=311 /DNA_END=1127 /DNA_ORIENTATION=-